MLYRIGHWVDYDIQGALVLRRCRNLNHKYIWLILINCNCPIGMVPIAVRLQGYFQTEIYLHCNDINKTPCIWLLRHNMSSDESKFSGYWQVCSTAVWRNNKKNNTAPIAGLLWVESTSVFISQRESWRTTGRKHTCTSKICCEFHVMTS